MAKKLTSRTEDYSKWYNELVVMADLAENSGVRGCMVIKPYGYAIWEKMQAELDKKFKDTGHVNAYFPLFIPKSLKRFTIASLYLAVKINKSNPNSFKSMQPIPSCTLNLVIFSPFSE